MPSSRQNSYDSLYGVHLLDDLHNYFPALLYEPNEFESVQDVLHYVAAQTRRTFDLYSYGQEAYFENEARRRVASEPRVSERPVEPQIHQFSGRSNGQAAPAAIPQNVGNRSPSRGRHVEVEENSISLPLSRNILSALAAMDMEVAPPTPERRLTTFANIANLYSLLNPTATPFMEFTFNNRTFLEPIQVRPTAAQIQAATRVGNPTTTEESTESCAICQDSITSNQNCRQIVQCEHWFHQDCIDPWFQQNVRCPVCRFDIRDHGRQTPHRRSRNTSEDIPAQPPANNEEGVN
jgi:hypothetical protein